jgi:multidrug efflux pump subunit AcrB
MVPLGSVATVRRATGPDRLVRYNLYPAVEVQGTATRGTSTGDALDTMEKLAADVFPPGMSSEWTEIAYQQRSVGNLSLLVFPLSVFFVFLFLTAQYESWSLPLAIILIVPLCILFALLGVWLRGMDNNILTQIGFIVLIGLASKNAILIVEFAKQQEDEGKDRFEAAKAAARLRLRPILMTAFAFILGVVPLVIATGAGAEMRRALGTAVFAGMIGVTFVGLLLTPIFYVIIRGLVQRMASPESPDPVEASP